MAESRVRAIVFDQGETLVNETRFWSSVAAYAGVPNLALFGVLGGLIERRENHRSLFNVMEIESVDPQAIGYQIEARDLYPDVVSTMTRLQSDGYVLGVAGNQPGGVVEEFDRLGLPLTLNASSTLWGVSKPDPAFFERMCAELGMQAGEVMYVGDRLDNDVLPAHALGMHAVFIKRGPWGYLHATWPEAMEIPHTIDTLTAIPDLVHRINEGNGPRR